MNQESTAIKHDISLIPPEPSSGLFGAVMGRIEREKKSRAKRRLALFACLFGLSGLSLIPTGRFFQLELSRTGFLQFVGIFFSDPQIALRYWQDAVFSLLEFMPVAGIACILGIMLVFLASARYTLREMKIAFN